LSESFFFLKNYYFDYEGNNQLGVISVFSLKMEETDCSTNFDASLIPNMLTWTRNSAIAGSGLSDLMLLPGVGQQYIAMKYMKLGTKPDTFYTEEAVR